METSTVIHTVASLISKFMDKLPDYDQRKKEEFHELWEEYSTEDAKDIPIRDDQRVVILGNKLLRFAQVFDSEISGAGLQAMRPKGN